MAFKVKWLGSDGKTGSKTYEGSDVSYTVTDAGILVVNGPKGARKTFGIGGWHSVEEPVAPSAKPMIGRIR